MSYALIGLTVIMAILISILRGVSIDGNIPNTQAGRFLETVLTVDGSKGGVDWALVGVLPDGCGVVYSGKTASISGVPSTPGTYTFTFKVEDGAGFKASRTFTVTITEADELMATDGTLIAPRDMLGPLGTVGEAYFCQIMPIGGVPPYSWTQVSGSLAVGLFFNTSNGEITGGTASPDVSSAAYYTLTDSASNSITVALQPVVINMLIVGSPPAGVRGKPYSFQFSALGGFQHSWSVSAGTLPSGMILDPSGELRGVPEETTAGTTITVECDSLGGATATKSVTIVVNAATITVDVDTPSIATVGAPYALPLVAVGAFGPATPSVVSGSLPPGFTFDRKNNIRGHYPNVLAEAAGTHTFTVRLTDAYGNSGDKSITIHVIAGPLIVNGGDDAVWRATAHVAWRAPEVPSIGAYGGLEPISWAVTSGSLPPGISFYTDFRSIYISGTPTTAGTYTATFTATDSQTPTPDSASTDVTITVAP